MPDRTTPPPFRPIERPQLHWPAAAALKPGIPLFVLHAGTQPIVKLELVFDAGTWYEPHAGVAYVTAKMLLEGTQHRNAQAIASTIDQYGASLSIHVQPDTWHLTLVTLSKHLGPMLTLVAELLLAPAFPAARLAHLKHRQIQALRVANEKNSVVARQRFHETLFGSTHPYGRSLTEETLAAITLAQVQHYYEHQLLAGCQIFVSGQVPDTVLQTIQQQLQPLPVQAPQPMPAFGPLPAPAPVQVPKPGSLQAALHLGQVLVPISHPDYLPLRVVIALLGGYFGARLMRNLREEKGYTYGISARIVPLRYASYLSIATEVIQAHAQAAVQEIEQEIKTLQTVPVLGAELQTLRHYLLGQWLATTHDPFASMERFKAVHLQGLDQTYYTQWYDTLMHLRPLQLLALAQQYFTGLSHVVVG